MQKYSGSTNSKVSVQYLFKEGGNFGYNQLKYMAWCWAEVLENCKMDACGRAGPSNGSAACLYTQYSTDTARKKNPRFILY